MIVESLILSFFVFIVIFLWQFIRKYREKWKDFHRIPGRHEYPIVGNTDKFFCSLDEQFKNDRQDALRFYPIFKISSLHVKIVFILHPDDVEQILSDMKHIKKSIAYDFLHEWLATGLLTGNGKKWQKRRKILTPAFHFNILQGFVDIFNDETKKLVNTIKRDCSNPYIDIKPIITHFALMAINDTAMGCQLDVTVEEKEEYKNEVHKMSSIIAYRTTRPWLYVKAIYRLSSLMKVEKKAVEILHRFTRKVIKDRETKFHQEKESKIIETSYSHRKKLAMLDLLIQAKADGADIDINGICEEVDTFMFAGHDTTSVAICYLLMLLANHPDIQEEVLREIREILGDDNKDPTFTDLQNLKFTERCIKESLRLYPSVPVISREIGEEIVTKTGYRLPKDCITNIMIYDIHHNPSLFEDPEKFDPDRFLPENIQKRHPFSYIPFSAGPRNCIGQKFAMLELKTLLCGILRNFRLEAVDKRENVKITLDIVLRPASSIRVKFIPRK